ncbi:HD domain-containing phosphohydrolase [Thalassobacillus hwangdonensis]|uniref:HD domain-containing phosphohydrolase n=1 Tax=Thalassobacillus hwangdonensis TaxID=546108 RepID=A0ABW3L4Q7_9BACI
MGELNVIKNDTQLALAKNNSTSIRLLEEGDGTEIMKQTINKDKMFYVYPNDDPNTLEFFYILSGEIEWDEDGKRVKLGPNDSYSTRGLKKPVLFETITDVTYLWFTTAPIFHQISKSMADLWEFIQMVDSEQKFAYDHSERVAKYSIKIAKKLEFGPKRLQDMFHAAFLHDIGKLNVSDHILNKPGKLTERQFNQVKRHPVDGANMMVGSAYESISDIILEHHERLDGSGYPRGMEGDHISLEAKIIAVCDSYDAMTENRVYRTPITPGDAIDEIKRLSGKLYDPLVVDFFEQILKEDKILSE